MIGILCLLIAPTEQSLTIEKINTELGYAEIKIDNVEIVNKFDIVLHIINLNEISTILNKLEESLNIIESDSNRNIAIHQIKGIKNQMSTLFLQRHKRGLVNFGGTVLKWAFGTMDDEDRQNIEEHLSNQLEANNHKVIESINQQVRINENFNKTFTLIKNAIEADRIKLASKINTIERKLYTQEFFLEQMVKIDFIRRQIENKQDNLASARLGTIHPNILTDDEIKAYDIDFRKLKEIRLGVARHYNESIIFAIKIPKEFRTYNKKLIIPVPNSNMKQIEQDIEYIVEIDNKAYTYEKDKALKELKLSKHCIFRNNCRFTTKTEEEYIEIDNDILVLSNIRNKKLNSSCDERKLILHGNYFINFQNCSVEIENRIYSNNIRKFVSKFLVPFSKNFTLNTTELTFEDVIIKQEENIKEIKELKYQKQMNLGLSISSISLIAAFIIFVLLSRRKLKLKLTDAVQENLHSNGGGVTLYNVNHNINKIQTPEGNTTYIDNVQNPDFMSKLNIHI